MKGCVILAVLSALILLCTPFLAFGHTSKESNHIPTATVPEKTAVFKVKNTQTGEVITWTETAFLIGIVGCEMAPSSPMEALKAQAVAAYTYYCKQRDAATDGVFSNVPDTLFTVGTEEGMRERFGDQYDTWYSTLKQAVDAVYGERILYENAPITACYHAISAGLTENATDVWGGAYPYLIPVDSAGDLSADGYATTVTFGREQLAQALNKADNTFTPTDTPETWFSNMITTDSGFVKSVNVCNVTFTGAALRSALSLRSPCFTVTYKEDTFTFTVHGYGHNVGMSQAGAKYMAQQGATYKEILAHYYPNTVLQ